MRTIVLLVSSIGGGGAERVATTLANAWAAAGAHVVLVPTFLGEIRGEYPLSAAVRLSPLRDWMPPGRVDFISKLRALRALVRSVAPDVVVSFLTNVNVVAILALLGLRIPVIVSERVDPAAKVELHWSLRLARRMLYQFAATLVVQTTDAAERYGKLLMRPPPIAVIPNPLPEALHLSTARAARLDASGGQVTAMGRLTPQKQFDLLIQAFATAFDRDSSWTLNIWGEGPLQAELQALIDKLGMSGRVRLCGFTEQPWVQLAGAQIFVLSSAYEGFPNAMLEAMALGLPCVAFDCPSGPGDLAAGEAAVLVSPGDVNGLAAALGSLARDPDRRLQLGRAAAASVRSRFSQAAVISHWDMVFASLRNVTRRPNGASGARVAPRG